MHLGAIEERWVKKAMKLSQIVLGDEYIHFIVVNKDIMLVTDGDV